MDYCDLQDLPAPHRYANRRRKVSARVLPNCPFPSLTSSLFSPHRNKGSFGFDKSFPADSKPIPRRLQLKPEHVQFMNQGGNPPLSFTPARFNSGVGEEEKSIVTSTGKFVVTCESSPS